MLKYIWVVYYFLIAFTFGAFAQDKCAKTSILFYGMQQNESFDSTIINGVEGFYVDPNNWNWFVEQLPQIEQILQGSPKSKLKTVFSHHLEDSIILQSITNRLNLNDSIHSIPFSLLNDRWYFQFSSIIEDEKITIDEKLTTTNNKHQIQYFELLKNRWIHTGKKPEIVVTEIYNEQTDSLKRQLNSIPFFDGSFIPLTKFPNQIYWNNEESFTVDSTFCLPSFAFETVNEIYAPGFYFSPNRIRINKNKDNNVGEIGVETALFTDHLKMFMPFNFSFKNEFLKRKSFEVQNVFFQRQPEIGVYASFYQGSYIKLDRCKKIGMSDHSFSISLGFCQDNLNKPISEIEESLKKGKLVIDSLIRLGVEKRWSQYVKISEPENKDALQILLKSINLRTKERFVVGIKDQQIMAQINDQIISTPPIIENLKWYQLTIQYDKFLQRFEIFIDGKLITQRVNVEPFKGDRWLYISDDLHKNSFIGFIDDLAIWQRALSHEEVQMQHQKKFIQVTNQTAQKSDNLLIILSTLVVLLLYIIFIVRKAMVKQNASKLLVPEIKLMGGFSILTPEKEELTSRMDPLSTELFLLLFFYSYQETNGIETNKLVQIIWPGLDEVQLRNLRGEYIKKLRDLLDDIGGTIEYKNGYWKLLLSEETRCDYSNILDLLKKFRHQRSKRIIQLLDHNCLLPEFNYNWLYPFKQHTRDRLLHHLLPILTRYKKKRSKSQFALHLCNHILCFDPLNDEVLATKIKWHLLHGQVSEAEETYKKYEQAFKKMSKDESPLSYQEFML